MPSKPAPITMDAVYTKPGYLFRRMQQVAVAIFMEECKAFDLTPVQYAALVAIQTHPGIDATRLSALIAFDRSTLGSVIERIESKGLVERKPSPQDKRIKLLYLTRSGADVRRLMDAVDFGERRRQQAVSRHRKPDPRLSVLENQQRRDHAHHSPDAHPAADVLIAQRLQGVAHGRRVA
jgi:DNA-binding MarR family transcriptional regulator